VTAAHPSAEQLALDLEPESAHDLYHRAPCGYLITATDGSIARVNRTFLEWTGYEEQELVGVKLFSDLLSVGSRIFHETHVAPLLVLQGEVREIAAEVVTSDGRRLPTFVNGVAVAATSTVPAHTRITVFDASQRHEYEAELLRARKVAEASEQQVRSVAETLQRSLMHGGVTSGDSFDIETRYRPAFDALEIGGDWHDSFFIDHRTLAVSVGDVVGRGITAACAMGQLRTAMRALACTGIGPGPLLDQIDAFVGRIPDARFATVAYAEIDTVTGGVRYACAGHLPPLVITPTGDADYLWGGRSGPVASVPRSEPRPEGTAELGSGSRLFIYTDGLIERRSRGIDPGLELLADVASSLVDTPLSTAADTLMAELLADEDNSDDVCLLALEHHGPGT
jgi:PAS domain S-box-containing protein